MLSRKLIMVERGRKKEKEKILRISMHPLEPYNPNVAYEPASLT